MRSAFLAMKPRRENNWGWNKLESPSGLNIVTRSRDIVTRSGSDTARNSKCDKPGMLVESQPAPQFASLAIAKRLLHTMSRAAHASPPVRNEFDASDFGSETLIHDEYGVLYLTALRTLR